VNIDRETPMLLPVDLREWVAPDDVVHFVLEAVKEVELGGGWRDWRTAGVASSTRRG